MKEIIMITIPVIGSVLCASIPTLLTIKKDNKKQKEEIVSQIKAIDKKIDKVDNKVDLSRIDGLKNFIVRCLDEIEEGTEIKNTTKERLYESIDIYTNELHQNSYIHQRVEKLEREGKL